MELEELAREYEEQYRVLKAKIRGLRPLLCIYQGSDRKLLERKLRLLYSMARECRWIAGILTGYGEEES